MTGRRLLALALLPLAATLGAETLPPVLYVARHQYAPDHHSTGTDFTAGDVSVQNLRPGAAIRRLDGTNATTLVDCPGGVIRDLEVSYDAKKILFSMRRTAYENFAVWEANADGSGLRRLTDGAFADIDPAYLPDGRIVFSSTRDVKFCGCNWHVQGNIFRMDADGSNLLQLGHNTLYESHPSVLPDGRILYDRWEYVDRHFGPSFGLWTMYPDGRGQALYYGNNAWSPGAILDAQAMPGNDPERVVCIFGSCHDRPRGALVMIDRRRGFDGMEPVVRSFPANITNLVLMTPDYGRGRDQHHKCEGFIDQMRKVPLKYEDPFPLDGDRVLVARQLEPKADRTGLFLVSFADGSERLVHKDETLGCFDPRPLVARRRPFACRDAIDLRKTTGVFYLADVYRGTGMEKVARGSIKSLRIVEAPPKRSRSVLYWNSDTTHRPAVNYNCTSVKKVLGEVPVAADGSATFEIPAGKFVFFQALDAEGRMVQSMRSGTSLQPGEVQSCVGCHESRLETSPWLKAGVHAKRPDRPRLRRGGVPRTFSYAREIQPIFDRSCVRCHDYGKPAGEVLNLSGDLGLVFNVSYMSLRAKTPFRWYADVPGEPKELLKPVDDGPPEVLPAFAWGSHRSRFLDILAAGHHGVKLPQADIDTLVEWIDLNMPYYPTYETAFVDNPAGRSPLSVEETHRLAALTGATNSVLKAGPVDSGRPAGTGVNFTRPELSDCLKGVTGTKYGEALALIRAGAKRLYEIGRPDIVGHEGPDAPVTLDLLSAKGGAGEVGFEKLFGLGKARPVVAVDFVAPERGVLPAKVEVFAPGGKVLAKDVALPPAENGQVYTLRIGDLRLDAVGFRVLENRRGADSAVGEFRVRTKVFTGNQIIGERGATACSHLHPGKGK